VSNSLPSCGYTAIPAPCRDSQILPANSKRHRNRVQYPLYRRACIDRLCKVTQDDEKLVGPDTSDRCGIHKPQRSLRHSRSAVRRRRSCSKPSSTRRNRVEIHGYDCDDQATAVGALYGVAEEAIYPREIRQSGERVIVCEAIKFGRDLL